MTITPALAQVILAIALLAASIAMALVGNDELASTLIGAVVGQGAAAGVHVASKSSGASSRNEPNEVASMDAGTDTET